MKSPILLALLTSLVVASAEQPSGNTGTRTASQPSAAPADRTEKPAPAKIRFKGKAGSPATCTITATRGGSGSNIRLAALAPGNEGVTCKARPRLWWHQSDATGPRELEFTLSRLDGPKPMVLLKRPLPSMPKGYNAVDLTNQGFNRTNVELESGGLYQWTVRLVSEKDAPQVFCRMKVAINGSLNESRDIQALSDSGNWYELFDRIATASEKPGPEAEGMASLRDQLLHQIAIPVGSE